MLVKPSPIPIMLDFTNIMGIGFDAHLITRYRVRYIEH